MSIDNTLLILDQERALLQAQIDACFKGLPKDKATLATERAREYMAKLDEARLAYLASLS